MQIMLRGLSAPVIALALACGLSIPAAADGTDYVRAPRGITVAQEAAVPVPVPAPIPVAEYAPSYYLRIDAAYCFSDSDRFKTDYDVYAPTAREDDGLGQFGRYGIGFGYYFTPWLRGDVTIDVRNEVVGDAVGDPINYTQNGLLMQDQIWDRIRYRNGTLLFNGYIDIPVHARFTPYIGAGVGVVLHSYERSLVQSITCTGANLDCDLSTPLIPDGFGTQHLLIGSDKDYGFALAAALMAGFSFEITHSTKLDLGYRFLHLDGETFTHRVTDFVGNITTRHLTIPDQNIHELRIGLRFDIN
jgi:opacity protein-like surface antigen